MQILTPSTDEYPDFDVSDILTALAGKERLAVERELFQTKWWDYRFMSPLEATLAYIDAFGVEARKIYARDIDYERAQHIRVVTGASVREGLINNEQKAKRAFTGFWRGRQVADALGMPYETYLAETLNSRMRYWSAVMVQDAKGKWRTKMPTANQLYGERDVERVSARWEELKASRVFYASHHAYMVENYCGAPFQDAYCAYLIDRARSSSNPVLSMADMIDNNRLPIEVARQQLDDGIYEQVMNSLS